MIVTRTKRRYTVIPVEITTAVRFRLIDIRLPSNVARVTGLLVTASASTLASLSTERLGLVSFQANDKSDVFHVAEVCDTGVQITDETVLGIDEPLPELDHAWVSGNVPRFHPVDIAGDNMIMRAWLKGENYQVPFTLKVYIEYQEAEELIVEEVTASEQSASQYSELAPLEIHL